MDAVASDAAGGLWISLTRKDNIAEITRLQNGLWTDFTESLRLGASRCEVMYGDARGRVWLGFIDGRVAVYDSGVFRFFSSKDGLPNGRVFTISR